MEEHFAGVTSPTFKRLLLLLMSRAAFGASETAPPRMARPIPARIEPAENGC